MMRDFDPDSLPLRSALRDEEVVLVLQRTRDALQKIDDLALTDLTKSLNHDKPSANFRWSPVKRKSFGLMDYKDRNAMQTFEEFAKTRALTKYLKSSVGTLFYGDEQNNRILVRNFSSAGECAVYVEILLAIKEWLEKTPDVRVVVELLFPFDIGTDFVAREHRIYTSTEELLDEEADVELPAEFFIQQKKIESAIIGGGTQRDMILKQVLRNSLLEPTGKTYFDFSANKFVIVDPKIRPDDITSWRRVLTK